MRSKTIVAAVLGCCYAAAYASAFVNHCHSSHMMMCSGSGGVNSVMKHTSYPTIFFNSDNNDLDSAAEDSDNIRSETSDPEGIPIFDTNDRATLFGLEPNAEMDPLDNNPGLQFTGPLIMFFSIYITLSLFTAGDGDIVLFDNIQ